MILHTYEFCRVNTNRQVHIYLYTLKFLQTLLNSILYTNILKYPYLPLLKEVKKKLMDVLHNPVYRHTNKCLNNMTSSVELIAKS